MAGGPPYPTGGGFAALFSAGVTPPNFPTVMNMGMTHYSLACSAPAFGVAGGLYPIRGGVLWPVLRSSSRLRCCVAPRVQFVMSWGGLLLACSVRVALLRFDTNRGGLYCPKIHLIQINTIQMKLHKWYNKMDNYARSARFVQHYFTLPRTVCRYAELHGIALFFGAPNWAILAANGAARSNPAKHEGKAKIIYDILSY